MSSSQKSSYQSQFLASGAIFLNVAKDGKRALRYIRPLTAAGKIHCATFGGILLTSDLPMIRLIDFPFSRISENPPTVSNIG